MAVFIIYAQEINDSKEQEKEPAHEKTYKMACAPSEDSDQSGHPPSLIRVFAVRMKKAWVHSYPLDAQRRLIRLGGCPGCCESSLGVHAILSCAGSNMLIFSGIQKSCGEDKF